MALDARVYCNCLELQVLRTQPLPEWQVHVTEEGGGRETKATDPETQMAFEEIPAPAQVLFDHVQARLQADVFWTKASIDPQVLHLWLDTYQTGKDFTRRGIVEVIVA